jgi:hypothetical protein
MRFIIKKTLEIELGKLTLLSGELQYKYPVDVVKQYHYNCSYHSTSNWLKLVKTKPKRSVAKRIGHRLYDYRLISIAVLCHHLCIDYLNLPDIHGYISDYNAASNRHPYSAVLEFVPDSLIVLEEPDRFVNLKDYASLCVVIKSLIKRGYILIVATNNSYIIQELSILDNVLRYEVGYNFSNRYKSDYTFKEIQ